METHVPVSVLSLVLSVVFLDEEKTDGKNSHSIVLLGARPSKYSYACTWCCGAAVIDWEDPEAARALTKTLLHHDFKLDWDIPIDRLCPPVRTSAILCFFPFETRRCEVRGCQVK